MSVHINQAYIHTDCSDLPDLYKYLMKCCSVFWTSATSAATEERGCVLACVQEEGKDSTDDI